MRRLAIGRTVGLLIAVAGVAGSVYYARDSYRRNNEFYQWFDDRPMESRVDLSQVGEITVPFHQSCSISHGEALFIHLTPGVESDEEVEELFNGLSATIVISDSDGKKIEQAKIDRSTFQRFNGSEDIVLTEFTPFQRGEYVATLSVDASAPELGKRKQMIYAKYQLCGLEHFPVLISRAFSIGAGIIGLIASVCVVPGVVRHGVWRASRTKDA